MKPLKNAIHVNRMKRFHHQAIVPPPPTDLQNLQGESVAEVDDLNVIDHKNFNDVKATTKTFIPNEPPLPSDRPTPNLDRLVDVELPDPPVLRTEVDSQKDE